MQTKIESYQKILAQPKKLGFAQQQVYTVICRNPRISDKEIAKILYWGINRVTARRNELIKQGRIRYAGTKNDHITKRTVKTYEANY